MLCRALSTEMPGHRQDQLGQILVVCLPRRHFILQFSSIVKKNKQYIIDLVTRSGADKMGLSDNTLEDPGKIRSVVDILTQAKCPIVVKMSQESQDADSPKVIDLYAGQPFRQLRLVVTAQTIQGIVVQYLDQEFNSTNGK